MKKSFNKSAEAHLKRHNKNLKKFEKYKRKLDKETAQALECLKKSMSFFDN